MELGFLFIIVVSFAAGVVFRSVVSVMLGRVLLWVGMAGLTLGLGILALMVWGFAPLGFWTGGLLVAALLVVGGLVLPFALAVTWGRW